MPVSIYLRIASRLKPFSAANRKDPKVFETPDAMSYIFMWIDLLCRKPLLPFHEQTGGFLNTRYECSRFSECVTYSKFPKLLFVLSPSLWFTSRLELSTKASMTRRCTNFSFIMLHFDRVTKTYPLEQWQILRIFPFINFIAPFLHTISLSIDLTFPLSLTSDNPS